MRPPPPYLHRNFFTSLKQVEKRLEQGHQSPPSAPSPPPATEGKSNCFGVEEDSLSSPIYLLHPEQPSQSSSLHDDSEPPRAFLSCSPQFPPAYQHDSFPKSPDQPGPSNHALDDSVDDIARLIHLLGLSDCCNEDEGREEGIQLGRESIRSCACEDEFYSKIVGVKGPKSGKEVKRLEGWIKHFINGGEKEKRIEPLRLAYLLLGKAAFLSESAADGGQSGLEFPSVVEEFLQNDPPKD